MGWKHAVITASTLALSFSSFTLVADPAEVVSAQLQERNGTWHVSVTVRHADTGWDHYADAWRVLDGGGRVLGERILHHPHVQEQPFTRSLSGVEIPQGTATVFIQARDNQSGWSPQTLEMDLGR
ncbi:MAG: hypothetical protein ABR558_10380 [Thioalkalivibrio sp.]